MLTTVLCSPHSQVRLRLLINIITDPKTVFKTHIFLGISVGLQDFEDDEFGEALEAGDQLVLLEHLGEDPEDQGSGGPDLIR